jgi:4-carboxymuconolactone decarboxylase
LLRWLRLTRSSGFAQKPRPFFINTIIVGERPSDLAPDEAIAYDVASALVSGHVLLTLTYRRAVEALGESSAMELIYLVGLYCFVSVTLNGFDVPLPE